MAWYHFLCSTAAQHHNRNSLHFFFSSPLIIWHQSRRVLHSSFPRNCVLLRVARCQLPQSEGSPVLLSVSSVLVLCRTAFCARSTHTFAIVLFVLSLSHQNDARCERRALSIDSTRLVASAAIMCCPRRLSLVSSLCIVLVLFWRHRAR